MKLPIFQVDAFSDQLLRGNPAAICPLTEMLPEQLMLSIARENNLSETAFLVGNDGEYRIRWFTPAFEVPLCGHATLASAVVIREFLEPGRDRVSFESQLLTKVNRSRGYGDFYHYHLLASGRIDVVVESDVKILDIAALCVIVEEAGGRFTDLDLQSIGLKTTTVLASNGTMHDTVKEYL